MSVNFYDQMFYFSQVLLEKKKKIKKKKKKNLWGWLYPKFAMNTVTLKSFSILIILNLKFVWNNHLIKVILFL